MFYRRLGFGVGFFGLIKFLFSFGVLGGFGCEMRDRIRDSS